MRSSFKGMGRLWEEPRDFTESLVLAKLIDKQLPSEEEVQKRHYGLVMKYELVSIERMEGGSPADFPYQRGDIFFVVHGVPDLAREGYHHVRTLPRHLDQLT